MSKYTLQTGTLTWDQKVNAPKDAYFCPVKTSSNQLVYALINPELRISLDGNTKFVYILISVKLPMDGSTFQIRKRLFGMKDIWFPPQKKGFVLCEILAKKTVGKQSAQANLQTACAAIKKGGDGAFGKVGCSWLVRIFNGRNKGEFLYAKFAKNLVGTLHQPPNIPVGSNKPPPPIHNQTVYASKQKWIVCAAPGNKLALLTRKALTGQILWKNKHYGGGSNIKYVFNNYPFRMTPSGRMNGERNCFVTSIKHRLT